MQFKQFNWLDYIFLGLIGFSILMSLARGFVRELCSLFNWVVATWWGFYGYKVIAEKLPPFIESPSLRGVLGFVLIFLFVLILGVISTWLLSQLVTKTGLGGTDKVLGLLFGGLRGVLIIALLILLARLTPLPEEHWWRTSVLVPYFQPLEQWLYNLLPHSIAEYLPDPATQE
jgi:membrane protein required for colicin V production